MNELFIVMVCIALPLVFGLCVARSRPRWRKYAVAADPYVWGYVALCWAVRISIAMHR